MSLYPCLSTDSGFYASFLDLVPSGLLCSSCNLILRQIVACGHRLCRPCLELIRKTSFRCPVDGEVLDSAQVYPDLNCRRQVMCLRVRCDSPGCRWKDELKEWETHQRSCVYAIIPCHYGCGMKLRRGEFEDEHQFSCQYRITQCSFCNATYPKKDHETHRRNCPGRTMNCPRCGISYRRCMTAEHEIQCDVFRLSNLDVASGREQQDPWPQNVRGAEQLMAFFPYNHTADVRQYSRRCSGGRLTESCLPLGHPTDLGSHVQLAFSRPNFHHPIAIHFGLGLGNGTMHTTKATTPLLYDPSVCDYYRF